MPAGKPTSDQLWETGEVRRSEGGPAFLQFVLCVPPKARFGLISDIDDTVLESKVTQWQAAAQLTFLHNGRDEKPTVNGGRVVDAEGVPVAGVRIQAIPRGRDVPWSKPAMTE